MNSKKDMIPHQVYPKYEKINRYFNFSYNEMYEIYEERTSGIHLKRYRLYESFYRYYERKQRLKYFDINNIIKRGGNR